MRLNRFVAQAAGVSRRRADELIAAGRVMVDGAAPTAGYTVNPSDAVTLDGQRLDAPAGHTYLALHKPAGYVSSRRRQGTSPVLYDLLPPDYHHLQLAGRLDEASSGLVLLSTDGDFIQRMSHPSSGKLKYYELTLDRPINPVDLEQLAAGVQLNDGLSLVGVVGAAGARLGVTLEEGRNRQLRRTLGALGYTIRVLHRTAVGPYHLGQLGPGQWQEIQP